MRSERTCIRPIVFFFSLEWYKNFQKSVENVQRVFPSHTLNKRRHSFRIICQKRALHCALCITDWQGYWRRDAGSMWRGCKSHFMAGRRKTCNGLNASKIILKWYVTTSLRVVSHERENLENRMVARAKSLQQYQQLCYADDGHFNKCTRRPPAENENTRG